MEPNYLFGVTKKIIEKSSEIRIGHVVCGGETKITNGTPCFMFMPKNSEDMGDEDIKEKTLCVFPFSVKTGLPPRYMFNLGEWGPIVRIGRVTDIMERLGRKNINRVDITKVPSVLSYVKNSGPFTLTINSNSKDAISGVMLLDEYLRANNKHTYILNRSQYGKISDTGWDGKVICCVTFTNVHDFLPTFYPKLTDGIIMHVTLMSPNLSEKYDKLVSSFETIVMYSKHKENLTIIDGEGIGIDELLDRTYVQSVIKEFTPYFGQMDGKPVTKKQNVNKPTKTSTATAENFF